MIDEDPWMSTAEIARELSVASLHGAGVGEQPPAGGGEGRPAQVACAPL